jgi:hypothetical protein
MAGRHLRIRSVTFVEDSIGGRDSNEVDETSSLDNTVVNQEAETEGNVTADCECNNSDSIVTTEVGVGMSTRQLYDLLTNAISTLRADITANLESKLQAATENITAKIQQEDEKLTQKLHNKVQKLSNDICTVRNDTEHKFQEVTRTIEGVSDVLNERIDTHVVATSKMTDRISEEINAKSGRLRDDVEEYRTETENSLREFGQDYILFREQINSEQAALLNKAWGEIDKVNDSVRLVERKVVRLVEDRVTEIQAAAQKSIEKVNTEITCLREQLATKQLTEGAIPNQALPVTAVNVEKKPVNFRISDFCW